MYSGYKDIFLENRKTARNKRGRIIYTFPRAEKRRALLDARYSPRLRLIYIYIHIYTSRVGIFAFVNKHLSRMPLSQRAAGEAKQDDEEEKNGGTDREKDKKGAEDREPEKRRCVAKCPSPEARVLPV